MKSGLTEKRWGNILSSENSVLFLIMFFSVFFRLLTVVNIETGGDAAGVWFYAKKIYYGLPYVNSHWSHHAARFGMIFPVYLVQLIFGTNPVVYYITPLLFFFLQVFFLFKVGVRSHSIGVAFLGCLLLIFFPQMFRHAVQIKPEGFCATYLIISVYFLFLYHDAEKRPLLHLLLSSAFLFLAYLTKVTSIFFLPGILIAVWLLRKRFGHAVLYAAVLFFLFIIETGLYYAFAGFPLGRLSIIMGTHLQSKNLQTLLSFWDLFDRYGEMILYWKIYFAAYLLAAGFLIGFLKKKMNLKILSVLLVSLSFFLFITFAVKSIDPLVPAMSNNHRHLVLAAPLMMMIISCALVELFTLGKQKSAFIRWLGDMPILRSLQPVARYTVLTLLLSLFCFAAAMVVFPRVPKYARDNFFLDHPFRQNDVYYRLLNGAYAGGIPIVQRKVVPDRFLKAVQPVRSFLERGYSLEDACRKTGVDESYYRYSLHRVQRGDYKAFKVFTHIFWDGDYARTGQISFPKVRKAVIGGTAFGYIVKDELFKGDANAHFNTMEMAVVRMLTKPFRAKEISLKDFLKER